MLDMTVTGLREAYLAGDIKPAELLDRIRAQSASTSEHCVWTHLLSAEETQPYLDALRLKDLNDCPLWGIPFAIKDNIDLAGIPTTAGCPEFAYTPDASAFVVQKLIDAGAIPIGKANLDQFATGLNGTRSPFGACRNAYNPEYLSGGSSSGSATAVALGLASFSLGTDTAGSGRVPAGFNNLIGVKPSIGLLSATGMVPACRTLDCMTIFALDLEDADAVLAVAEGYDPNDAYSRPNPFSNQVRNTGFRDGPLKIGVLKPKQLQFFGSTAYAQAYAETIATLESTPDVELVEINFEPFNEAALLLYEGAWVAERYLATQSIIDHKPEAVHSVVRSIIEPGKDVPASQLFSEMYRLEALKKRARTELKDVDCLITPTAGRHFTLTEMLANPTQHNSELGYYTNFMNLFDMAALSIPATFTDQGLPFGLTLSAQAFSDRDLMAIARRLQTTFSTPVGTSSRPRVAPMRKNRSDFARIDIAVCGAHLDGLPLNWQLRERGATLQKRCFSSEHYCLYQLPGGPIKRPAMVRNDEDGRSIELEVWSVPASEIGSFLNGIPQPLGLGKIELDTGRWVTGFICDAGGLKGATDITEYGGWRRWLSDGLATPERPA